MWLILWIDFRSHDGLYALLAAEDSGIDETVSPKPAPAAEEGVIVNDGGEESRTVRRSSRLNSTTTARYHVRDSPYRIADPQEIVDINVFRAHPQIF